MVRIRGDIVSGKMTARLSTIDTEMILSDSTAGSHHILGTKLVDSKEPN